MSLGDRIKTAIVNWLRIQPATDRTITIYEPYTHAGNVMKNRIWYRGEPSELSQFYKSVAEGSRDSVNAARFWAAVPSEGLQIRKIHTGLPQMCVDKIAAIVTDDMEPVQFGPEGQDPEQTDGAAVQDDTADRWETISEENDWKKLVRKAVAETDVAGDGAFKISLDPDVSGLPIIEFYSGERVGYTRKRGRITEVLFYSDKELNGRDYRLEEVYGKGYIRYNLYDLVGKPVNMDLFPELSDLKPVSWTGEFMLGVPLMFAESPRFPGRGKSLFDGKCDSYDAFDEDVSQWTDAFRAGRITKYIPEDMIPRDSNTGEVIPPNPFDNQYIAASANNKEGVASKIEVVQPTINSDSFQQKYSTDLDLCLQGVLSPSTLGIDVKKLDNAESQREKEKTTMYTRSQRIDVLEKVLPKLVDTVLKADDLNNDRTPKNYECTVTWGEYANPSFEAVVETVGKARQYGIMSAEASVEEMWGDTRDKKWKDQEVARIKSDQGIETVAEPSAGDMPSGEDVSAAAEDATGERLNGAQVQSLMNVIQQVTAGTLGRNAAVSIITSALGLSSEAAESILDNTL